jgi:hypothetical protein
VSRIPGSTSLADLQQSFRDVWAQVDKVLGSANLDFSGRRIINAGRAQDGQDYVTKLDLEAAVRVVPDSVVTAPASRSVLIGTHAARLARTASPPGTLWYETDRTVFYVAQNNAWLYVAGIMRTGAGDVEVIDPNPAPTPPDPPTVPPTDPGGTNTNLTIAQPAGVPASPNLRWFRGNLCGVRVPGLPSVSGGAADPSLVLSWFYDRYNATDRAAIRAAFHAHGYTHFKLSWPDSRDFGTSEAAYVVFAQELAADGFYVGHFLSSKDYDPANPATILAGLATLLPALQGAAVIPWASVGWELSLWLDPTQVQTLVDGVAAVLVPGTNLYVHFQQDYIAFQQPGGVTADFWNLNVGKLTGLLHQKELTQGNALYQARIDDGLSRFAGNFLFATDSGFGHPFDYVTYEVSAADQFSGSLTQAQGDAIGKVGAFAPAQSGPAGTVAVQGFGNGATAGFY